MANPPKKKGTAAETELRKELMMHGLTFVRTPASSPYDLTNQLPDRLELDPLEVLATRPDRGQWLVTMRLDQFAELLHATDEGPNAYPEPRETHIEVKRYARFSLHTIFEKKFGRKS